MHKIIINHTKLTNTCNNHKERKKERKRDHKEVEKRKITRKEHKAKEHDERNQTTQEENNL